MRVERHVSIDASADDVWRRVGDPARYPRFMPDVTRCEPVPAGDHDDDRDDRPRFRMTARVGAVELGSTIAVTASRPGRELCWESVAGVRQRGAWRLAERPDGTTAVTLTVEYHAPHGLLGAFADPAALPLLHRSAGGWLTRLKADVEGRARPSAMTAAVTAAGEAAYDATVLSRAGLVVPSRPTRLLRAGLTLARRRISPATGYAVAAALHPGDAAVVDERGTLTFAELDRSADALARRLAEAGVGPGGALAVLCRNHRGFVQATLAASRLGADALLLNTGLAGPQLGEILARERPAGVVHDDEFTDAVAALPGGAPRIVAWCDGAPPAGRPTIDELTAGADEGRVPAPRRRGRVVLLTSGTTGAPRGAARQEPGSLTAAAALLGRIPLRARERTLVASPLFHSWGYTHLALASVLSSTLVLRRRFDAEATLALAERHRIAGLVVVPTMLQRLLALPADVRRRYDTASLRVVATSGAALPGPLATRFMDAFGDVLYNLYGSTEVAWAAVATPHDLRAAPGTAGRPPHGTRVAILDDLGRPVPAGSTGRIFAGNAMSFERYTDGTGTEVVGGLMRTGDLGHLDDAGRLFVDGRDDDMVVSGGENVFPSEVADALAADDSVADAAVVGVPDEEFGQRLEAFVVPAPGQAPSPRELADRVRRSLAPFKVPREIHIVDDLPRNETGKIDRARLAAAPSRAAR